MSADDTREFIIDCLSNPANAEKQTALEQWLQQSEANRTLYVETKQLWDAAAHLPPTPFNQSEGWQTLLHEISNPSAHVVELKREIASSTREEAPGVTAPFLKRFQWIAAACLPLFLLASWYLWQKSTQAVTVQTLVQKDIALPDGSTIQLQPNTHIIYNPSFAERHITLTQGEAYFSVSPDEKRTFIVQLASSTIKVLGTAFYVKASATAAEVAVKEGKVLLATTSDTLILTKGQKGQVTGGGKLLQPDLIFANEEAGTVAAALSIYYQVNIKLPDSSLKTRRITASFQHMSATQAQHLLNAVLEQ